ncbi:hypothetical protein EJB05_17293, partial [Eragrostis curvula]
MKKRERRGNTSSIPFPRHRQTLTSRPPLAAAGRSHPPLAAVAALFRHSLSSTTTTPPLPVSSSPSYGLPRASSPHLCFTPATGPTRNPASSFFQCAGRRLEALSSSHWRVARRREPARSSFRRTGRRTSLTPPPSALGAAAQALGLLPSANREFGNGFRIPRFLVKKAKHYGITFMAAPAVLFLVLLAVLLVYHL